MLSNIVQYEHKGATVSVREDLKDRHREHCLCYGCAHFKPGTEENCEIAQAIFATCVKFDVITPVWACPKFEEPVSI